MNARCLGSLVFAVVVLGLACGSSADQRFYVWTYEYKTVERGMAEVEHYFTLSTPDKGHMEGTMTSEHQIELEVGMTDRFDFSVYQTFRQKPGEGVEYAGFKFRSRYRFGERGRHFFDPLLYAEYKGKPDFHEHGIELKLILAKDVGRFNIALNPVLEFEHEDEWEVEPEYALGASYQVLETLRLGLEAKGSEYGHYIGPVVSHGTEHLWVALGSILEIGEVEDGEPEFQIRMLVGVGVGS